MDTVASDRPTPRVRPTDFEAFYRTAWDAVYRPLVATIGDADLAAEAVDEAMVRAYARWSTVASVSNTEGWVYRVALRWAIDRIRRRQREKALLARLGAGRHEDEPLVEPGLDSALSVLPIEQRAVVVLAVSFEWSEREIASSLGIRPGTVKSRLHRGMARLRKELGT